MERYYSTTEYRISQLRRKRKNERRIRNKKAAFARKTKEGLTNSQETYFDEVKSPVFAPIDLRLIENTDKCLLFFRQLRSKDFVSSHNSIRYVRMTLKDVKYIDYAAISILTAISDDLKAKNIILRGDFPDDPSCQKLLMESGFLDHMFEEKTGRRFKKAVKSELIFFEKGCGKLSEKDNKNISETIKHVVEHLTGTVNQCKSVKSIILEICGNSIEWGGTVNKQWLLGVKYEEGKAIFTVTDVGKGILETLHKKFGVLISDFATFKSSDEILKRAFDRKYGSNTQEVNRNKGLPSIKQKFQFGIIRNLIVITNNVILHFSEDEKSKSSSKGSARFRGTFYQWEMNSECLQNLNRTSNE